MLGEPWQRAHGELHGAQAEGLLTDVRVSEVYPLAQVKQVDLLRQLAQPVGQETH